MKPYIPPESPLAEGLIASEMMENFCYLLTEIKFDNAYFNTSNGKKAISNLEKELETALRINHDNVNKIYAYTVDRTRSNSSTFVWKIRLLTEYSHSYPIGEIIESAGFINLATARVWMIRLLEGLESLHKSGMTHKCISLQTVRLIKDADFGTTIPKLMHPSYGYTILDMISHHPQVCCMRIFERQNLIWPYLMLAIVSVFYFKSWRFGTFWSALVTATAYDMWHSGP